MAKQNEMFILYEPWQVDEAISRVASGEKIICFDFLSEQELKKKNIPYISLRDFLDSETGETEWWLLAQEIAREWYRLPAMTFFEYDGIRIGEAVESILAMEYLVKLFYYARIYVVLKKLYPNAHFSISRIIVEDTPTGDCFLPFERRVVIDAARMVGLNFDELSKPAQLRKHSSPINSAKLLLARVYSNLVGFISHLPTKSGRRLKLYAVEYWSHIGPVIEQMEDVELIIMDNSELSQIPIRQLLKYRVRARHPNDVTTKSDMQAARRISDSFSTHWQSARKDVAKFLTGLRGELDWSPLLEALDHLISYAPHIIGYIDATRRIMTEERPSAVLQLQSASDRYHSFFVVAHVARQLGIPSIELQHAAAYIDTRAAYSRIETKYLATYGTDINIWHERIGNSRGQLITVGAPRFDQHLSATSRALAKGKQLFAQFGLDPKRPVLLAAVPFPANSLCYHDSYQLAEFFTAIHAAQAAIPGLQVLYKYRNNNAVGLMRAYVEQLSPSDSAVAGAEDVFALLCASDAVVCGNSTLIYQAILAKIPVALYGWKIFDTYNAQIYTSTMPIAWSQEDLQNVLTQVFKNPSYRQELLARQEQFLRGYSFDGKSSERIAALLRGISQKKGDTMKL